MKKILCAVLVLAMTLGLCACGAGGQSAQAARVYVFSGPTGVGAVNLWHNSQQGTAKGAYSFQLASANDQVVAAISNGSADLAAMATNLAASLYNKTQGGVTVLAVNTTSVLYLLGNGETFGSVADLKGKTIYANGEGANPEYILKFVLTENGLDPYKDVTVNFVADAAELPTVWAKDPTAILLAPQPVATTITMRNPKAVTLFNMGEEWKKVAPDSELMMGCVVARTAYLQEHPEEVATFLTEYKASIQSALDDPAAAGKLCEQYGIIPKAAIAQKAIPACGLTYVDGKEMKTKLNGYLTVLDGMNPTLMGGGLPGEDFYYEQK